MKPLEGLGWRLARIPFIHQAIAERADLSVFKARPSWRLIIGVTLITIAQMMGMPAVVGFGVLAAWFQEPWFLAGAPVSYLLSWIIWGLGMWLAGPDNIMYLHHFLRWAARTAVEWMIGGQAALLLETRDSEEKRP